MRKALAILLVTVSVAYPVAVYFGLRHFSPQTLAGALALLVAARLLISRQRTWLPVGGALLAFSLFAMARDDAFTLRFYPVMVNLGMLLVFAASLYGPMPVIERLARLREPNLPPEGVRYTRRVTQIWCGFFIVNGTIALYTALFSSLATWTLYNGLVAYFLMGALFIIELLCRIHLRKRRQP